MKVSTAYRVADRVLRDGRFYLHSRLTKPLGAWQDFCGYRLGSVRVELSPKRKLFLVWRKESFCLTDHVKPITMSLSKYKSVLSVIEQSAITEDVLRLSQNPEGSFWERADRDLTKDRWEYVQ